MPRKSAPVSAIARLPETGLVRTFVWELPVRIAHWLIFFAIVVLTVTGLYIHRPFLLPWGRASYVMGTVRFVHLVAGFVLIGGLAFRVYWFFKGNFWSKWYAYVPIHKQQWASIGRMIEFYAFMRFTPGARAGHNSLAALSYVVIYALMLVEILTGLALYSQLLGNDVLKQAIGWLPMLIGMSYLRLIHYFLLFVFAAFALFHVYLCVLISIKEENGLLDSIFSGWKFLPAGELRHELQQIPEAKRFLKRHELLPQHAKGDAKDVPPKPRPGPGPIALFRNWISYAGTGIVAIGVVVFVVLTAYHTIGGGAMAQPYGDLVIFFLPPVFLFAGLVVVAVGMWVQWLRWRWNKPLSFGRYPKWDLNNPAERKALLVVAIAAAILSVPAIYGTSQAYLYSDAVSFCGEVCHSMTPEHTTYKFSPHAHVSCAECHVGEGATGYIVAKTRGMVELLETIQDDYPRPIPTPVKSLRPLRASCERCHWPAKFYGSHEVRRVHYMSDEQNTPWEIDMLVRVGGGSGRAAGTGIHWHVASKVEYVAADAKLQEIPWVRAVDPVTGIAKIYTTKANSSARPPGEVRTMDCVDCHNRPTHVLTAPDRGVDEALYDGRIDASLPYIKQQAVAALIGNYATREEASKGMATALHGYYEKSYPQLYGTKRAAIDAAVKTLGDLRAATFFPAMKVRWDTYATNNTHFYSLGCARCHDGQHKSVDGGEIRSDCNGCHTILRQGPPDKLQSAQGVSGLPFTHPMDIGTGWAEQPCSTCHSGGPM